MMAVIPKHKGTERLRGQLKSRMAKLREELQRNFDEVRREVYHLLHVIRVYTKSPGKEPDLADPVILSKRSTVEDVAVSVHKEFAAKLRYARIWGFGKFGGQAGLSGQ